jgi:hypothetical protein
VRFSFFRSSLSSTLVVSATCNLFHCNIFCVPHKSGRETCILTGNASPLKAPPSPLNRFPACIHEFPAYNEHRLNVIRLLGSGRFTAPDERRTSTHL